MAGAVTPNQNTAYSEDGRSLSLVFADDFSTDPNTNGQWTIHRYADDPASEAKWSPSHHSWHLTRPATDRGVAVFANYDLTATVWKAEFRYRVSKLGGVNGGGDGFVFMFYKNKNAYGTPAFGTPMGFQLSNGSAVPGYGLEFDNYFSAGCDPTSNRYIGLVQDDICNSLIFREDDRTDDDTWHDVEFHFRDGTIRVAIDGEVLFGFRLTNPDYGFSGIGFGAGTGSAVADHEIDNFRLWVPDGAR